MTTLSPEDIILDHYHHPRNSGTLPNPTHHAGTKNLSCGDSIEMDMVVKNDKIEAVGWNGQGCAISQASVSIMSEHILGMSTRDVRNVSKESVLSLLGISPSPARLRCALLSLETIHRALSDNKEWSN